MFNRFCQKTFCARDDIFFNVFQYVESSIFSSKKLKNFFVFEMIRMKIVMILFKQFSS
jgi:hypothetical protein